MGIFLLNFQWKHSEAEETKWSKILGSTNCFGPPKQPASVLDCFETENCFGASCFLLQTFFEAVRSLLRINPAEAWSRRYVRGLIEKSIVLTCKLSVYPSIDIPDKFPGQILLFVKEKLFYRAELGGHVHEIY